MALIKQLDNPRAVRCFDEMAPWVIAPHDYGVIKTSVELTVPKPWGADCQRARRESRPYPVPRLIYRDVVMPSNLHCGTFTSVLLSVF